MKQSTRERPLAPDRQQTPPPPDDLGLVGRADVAGRLASPLDGGLGEVRLVFVRLDDALHPAVEARGERPGVGGDRHAAVGVEPEHVGRKQRRGPDALAVLGRHGDHQAADAPRSEGLQHTVKGTVERLRIEKRVDGEGELFEGGIHGVKLFWVNDRPPRMRTERQKGPRMPPERERPEGDGGFPAASRHEKKRNPCPARRREVPQAASKAATEDPAGGAAPVEGPDRNRRRAAGQPMRRRSSANEKSLSRSSPSTVVWNSHQTGTRSTRVSASPSGSEHRAR